MSNHTLTLVLTGHWFDEVVSGRKRHEYRAITPYWIKRLTGRIYSFVRFQRGYTNINATYKIISITKTTQANDLNLAECFDIEFQDESGGRQNEN